MKIRVHWVEKQMRPVNIGPLLTVNPGIYAVPEYVARTDVIDAGDLEEFAAGLLKTGAGMIHAWEYVQ